MNRYLSFALTVGIISPIAANAESYWLVLTDFYSSTIALEKIEMESMAQCEEQGKLWSQSREYPLGKKGREILKYFCLKGK